MTSRWTRMALAAWLLAGWALSAAADDWPTYRHDSRRSGITSEKLAPVLSERWTFTATHRPSIAWPDPQPKPVEDVLELPRLRFDDAYHVAVADGRAFFGSSADNTVVALDAATGRTLWVFHTGGPVRLAPTVADGKVYVGSDDGHVYCLAADDGRLLWGFAAAPTPTKVLGSGRMISLWPVRTGVLVEGGTAYFAAGLFPAEGLGLYAVNADDGRLLWVNDSYGRGGLGTVSPQGYLVASEDRLFVPSGRAMPAAFSRRDGRQLFQTSLDWRKVGLFGGTFCLLAGDRLCIGTEQLLLLDESNGKLASTVEGRRAVITPDSWVVLTGEEIIAADPDYWALRTRLKNLATCRTYTKRSGAVGGAAEAAAPPELPDTPPARGSSAVNKLAAGGVLADWIVLGPFPSTALAPRPKQGASRSGYGTDFLADLGGEEKALLAADTAITCRRADGQSLRVRAGRAKTKTDGYLPHEPFSKNVGYAFAYIESDRAQTAHVYFGSDGSPKVWVNGRLVLSKWVDEHVRRPWQYGFTVRLGKGLNPILVKLDSAKGPWGLQCRAYGEAAHRQAVMAALAEPSKASFPRLILGDLDELERDLTGRLAKALKWRLPCKDTDSIVMAGGAAIVGGRGIVRAFDVAAGRETWLSRVNGAARGLAVAGGRLLVSTDAGSIHCFAAGADGPARSLTPPIVADPFAGDRPAADQNDLAGKIVADSGVRRGYALILGGDGRLAFDLARRTDLMVYLVDPDEKRVAAARRALMAAGLYGTRVTVAHAENGSPAYSDYFANLIVCRGDFLPKPAAAPLEEVQRMLKPCGGVAYLVGLPEGVPAGRPMQKEAEGAGLKVEKAESWTKITRGPLPGAGSWTHQYADPSNSACGDDQLIRGSLGVLWYGEPGPDRMPSRHSGNVAPLSFDGRLFVQGENFIAAYDAYNGLLLWQRDMPGALRLESVSGVSNLAGGADGLFVAISGSCQRLDPATGKTLAYYGLPSANDENRHQWVYTACADGLVFGSRDTDCLFALEVKTRKRRWICDGNSIQLKTVCIGDGRVYFVDRSVTDAQRAEAMEGITHPRRLDRYGKPIGPDVRLVVCLDAQTGKRIWARPQYVSDCVAVGSSGGDLTAMYSQNVLVLCGQPWNGHFWKEFFAGKFSRRSLIALAGDDGRSLWSGHKGYRSRPLIVGDAIIAEPWAHDLKTGAAKMRTHPLTDESSLWQMSRPGHHCGNIAAAPNVLLFRSGCMGYYDLPADSGTVHFGAMRPGCWINCIPANGLVMMPEASSGCVCPFALQCTIVFQPRKTNPLWAMCSAEGATTPVERLAVNLGAPGDRHDAAGKLWLCHPRPRTDRLVLDAKVAVALPKEGRFFARNDRFATVAGTDYAWIFASGCEGLTRCTIPLADKGALPRRYTVRLFFADPANDRPGRRAFNVQLQGKPVLEKFDVAAEAGGANAAVVKEFPGVTAAEQLSVDLKPVVGQTLLCGVEVLAEK